MNIDKQNYEEWMVAFLDGELNSQEQKAFLAFMEKHPVLKQELTAFENIIFKPEEDITYEPKERLYKKSGLLLVARKAWPFAAAIVLLLGIWPFVKNNKSKNTIQTVQQTQIINKTVPKNTTPNKQVIELNNTNKKEAKEVAIAQKAATEKSIPNVLPVRKKTNLKRKPIAIANVKNNIPTVRKPNTPEVESIKEIAQPYEEALEEVIIVRQKPKMLEQPKLYLQNEKETASASKNNQTKENNALAETGFNILLTIDNEHNPKLHKKLTEVATKIADRIDDIKELKRTPITVCIGKRKLFTVNN